MHKLKELKERLCSELERYGERDLTMSSLETIDTLAHAIKNLDKIIGKESEGYSNRGMSDGGWSNAKGRYPRYSYADTMDSIKVLMDNAPDEQTRKELERLMQKFE